MRPSTDITTDAAWIDEQVDRLLGFEVLTKAISGNPSPMPPALLADKIGTYKGFPHSVINEVSRKAHG
jgi:hypothetical protein